MMKLMRTRKHEHDEHDENDEMMTTKTYGHQKQLEKSDKGENIEKRKLFVLKMMK